MITIDKSLDGKLTVSGDKPEVMLFFCVWQTMLWPDWITETLIYENTMNMHKRVINVISDDGVLVLDSHLSCHQDCVVKAIMACLQLGVNIQHDRF